MQILRDFFRVRPIVAKYSYCFFTDLPSNDREFHRIGVNTVTEISSAPLIRKLTAPGTRPDPSAANVARVREAAVKLEASFLAEMLKSAGFGEQQGSFAGGIGEEQFASFHREAIAQKMAEAGGIGLAQHFFNSMMEKQDEA